MLETGCEPCPSITSPVSPQRGGRAYNWQRKREIYERFPVFFYLEHLEKIGCEIIFSTTSENISDKDFKKLKSLCTMIIHRPNIGYDFGSWLTAYQHIDKSNCSQVILTNDSVYGPLYDLGPYLDIVDQDEKKSVYGFFSSNEISFHLPPVFFVFSQEIIKDKIFDQYWRRFKFFGRKERIIRELEVGGSTFLQENGVELNSFFDVKDLKNTESICSEEVKDLVSQNVTLLYWEPLITEKKFPFIKTEVLKQNRFKFSNIGNLKEVISQCEFHENYDLIKKHLKELGWSSSDLI